MILIVICGRLLLVPEKQGVYLILAAAGRHWLAGIPLYDASNGLDIFRYSPLVAALLVPLGQLPDLAGGLIWRLLNAAVYLGGLHLWMRSALPPTLSRRQAALIYLLIVPLSVGNLNNGQSNPLAVGLLLMTVAAATGERWNWASVCLAVACLFKVYPVVLGLLLAAVCPRRFAGRFAVALALGTVLPFLLQRPDYVSGQYVEWLAQLRTSDRQSGPLELSYRDIRFLLRVWFVPMGPGLYRMLEICAGLGMAGIGLAGRLQKVPKLSLVNLLFGLACCWMTVFGPATESCTYIFLAPPLAWHLLQSFGPSASRLGRWFLLASSFILFLAQVSVWFPNGGRYRCLGPQPLAGLLFLVFLAGLSIRACRTGEMPVLPRPDEG